MTYTPKPIPLLDASFDEEGSLPSDNSRGPMGIFEGQFEDEDESEIPTEPLRAHIVALDAQKYLRWIQHVKPGTSRTYHLGNLMVDRESDKHADLFAKLFMRASDYGLVLLVQKRWPSLGGPSDHFMEYKAYRTSRDLTAFHLRDLQTIISEFVK